MEPLNASIKLKRVGLAKTIRGSIFCVGGILLTLSPVIVGFLMGLGGGGGGGLILTIVPGFILTTIGIISMFRGIGQSLRTRTPAESVDLELRANVIREKAISTAILVPVVMLSSAIICFVIGNMGAGPTAGSIAAIVSAIPPAIVTVSCVLLAVKSKLPRLRLVLSTLSVVFLAGIYLEAQTLYVIFVDQITSTYK